MEEEKIYKDIELRSEEVQEVMNHISPWVVRCGITVLAVDSVDGTGWLLDIQVSGHLGGRGDSGHGGTSRLCAVTCYWETRYALCEEREFGGVQIRIWV